MRPVIEAGRRYGDAVQAARERFEAEVDQALGLTAREIEALDRLESRALPA